ncbi:hypothetical protein [Rhizobium sp.]|uniref:hypothetical protein n=1 Tax=Rhizobium sp. TaxID=391 RepID=UPI00289D1DDD
MIIVIEGISAAGKTTWCRKHAQAHLIRESYPADRKEQPEIGLATAHYWADWNAKRWSDALSMEQATGHAICDTDPLKLHYNWCMLQIGALPRSQWELQLETSRATFLERRIGFADAYLVKMIDPVIARQQRDGDTSRQRDRFDQNVLLQPALIRWYKQMEKVLGGRMCWELPETGFSPDDISANPLRYHIGAFDAFIASLHE